MALSPFSSTLVNNSLSPSFPPLESRTSMPENAGDSQQQSQQKQQHLQQQQQARGLEVAKQQLLQQQLQQQLQQHQQYWLQQQQLQIQLQQQQLQQQQSVDLRVSQQQQHQPYLQQQQQLQQHQLQHLQQQKQGCSSGGIQLLSPSGMKIHKNPTWIPPMEPRSLSIPAQQQQAIGLGGIQQQQQHLLKQQQLQQKHQQSHQLQQEPLQQQQQTGGLKNDQQQEQQQQYLLQQQQFQQQLQQQQKQAGSYSGDQLQEQQQQYLPQKHQFQQLQQQRQAGGLEIAQQKLQRQQQQHPAEGSVDAQEHFLQQQKQQKACGLRGDPQQQLQQKQLHHELQLLQLKQQQLSLSINKLKSYVEMDPDLKRSFSPLQPENFTFARQPPAYRPPAEIVRHAMQRGESQHQVQPSQIINSARFTPAKAIDSKSPAQVSRSSPNSTASESEEQFSMSIAEGRAKGKRIAPNGFEDKDYAESPFKKKTQNGPPGNNGNQTAHIVTSGKPIVDSGKQSLTGQHKQQLSLQEKRKQLQHQLYQQVHEKTLKQELETQKQMTNSLTTNTESEVICGQNMNDIKDTEINITKMDANDKQIILPLNARKSFSVQTNTKPKINPQEDIKSQSINKDVSDKSDIISPSINGDQTAPVVASGKFVVNSGKQAPTGQQKQQLSLHEKRIQLQHQLYQKVIEKSRKQQELKTQKQTTNSVTTNGESEVICEQNMNENIENYDIKDTEINITKIDANGKQIILPLNARKSISVQTNTKPMIEPQEDIKSQPINTDINDKSDVKPPGTTTSGEQVAKAPCSMHCPGKRGMLPNLKCSHCFCLYHLDCTPGGVFLEEPRIFVCPNCLTPEDTQKSKESKFNGQTVNTNGVVEPSDLDPTQLLPKCTQSMFVSSTPLIIQQPIAKTRFVPILPKPPQLSQSVKRSGSPLQPENFTFARQPIYPPPAEIFRHAMQRRDGQHQRHPSQIIDSAKFTPAKVIDSDSPGDVSRLARNSTASENEEKLSMSTLSLIQRQLPEVLHPMKTVAKKKGYSQCIEKRKTAVQSLLSPYLCLNQVLSYLTVTDLTRLRQVSRVWNQLSSQPFLWRNLKLKGIQINDWQFLAQNIIEFNASFSVDFDGVKPTPDLVEFWRNFSQIVDFLKSVRHLRFGTIPTFVLEEIANAAITENPYNSFSILEELTVKNSFEEESDIKECRLSFLADFQSLKALKILHLNCENGFIADNNTIELLINVFREMPSLTTLVLTSLKDFTSEQFVFLTSLTKLKHLEIGSCLNWFQTHEEDDEQMTDVNALSGAFKYLSHLTELTQLRLVDITIDDCSQSLPQTLESLTSLESLTIDNLKIEASGMDILEHFCIVLKSLPIHTFSISTDDSNTNKCVFDLLKKLDNCSKLFWKVGAFVEDSVGEYFVPFKRDEENAADDAEAEPEVGSDGQHISVQLTDRSVKYMDLTFLNEVIQSELSNAIIEIIPQ